MAKSWHQVGYDDGFVGKPPRPPEAGYSVRCQYNEGYAKGYDLFITASWNKPVVYASGLKPTTSEDE